jgi:alpha-tubulin suppressor-like RCC1 family protein
MHLLPLSQVLSFGRNLDGQLGIGSRKESKAPARVTALADDVVCHVACGPDYSVAVSETGTVFAWGSNSSAQHGRAPIDEDPAGAGGAAAESKVST